MSVRREPSGASGRLGLLGAGRLVIVVCGSGGALGAVGGALRHPPLKHNRSQRPDWRRRAATPTVTTPTAESPNKAPLD